MHIDYIHTQEQYLAYQLQGFALQGNVFDLAVGIIIGTVFSNVVKSLVEDIITPPFGFLLGGVDFGNLTIRMHNFVYKDQPSVVIRYEKFIQEVLYLLIMARVLFSIIKSINKLHEIARKRRLEEEAKIQKELSDEVKVLFEIRDILSQKSPIVEELIL